MTISWGHGDVEGASTPVDELRPDRIALSPASSRIATGGKVRLYATAYYRDGSSLDITRRGRWSTSKIDVVTVDGHGVATGVGTGLSIITFLFGTASATAAVASGGDLMLAARYTVTADDVSAGGDVFTIPLDREEDDADYGALAEVAEGDSTIRCQVPISGRTTTQVAVLATAPLAEGDIIEVFTARSA